MKEILISELAFNVIEKAFGDGAAYVNCEWRVSCQCDDLSQLLTSIKLKQYDFKDKQKLEYIGTHLEQTKTKVDYCEQLQKKLQKEYNLPANKEDKQQQNLIKNFRLIHRELSEILAYSQLEQMAKSKAGEPA